ncbi:MAG: hypothetical protein ABMA25_11755, partial [Ilumatobacteraceae bacterium]
VGVALNKLNESNLLLQQVLDVSTNNLAKLETSVAITSLIRRFPEVALAGEPHWRDRLTIRGVDHLPVSLR